MGQVTDYAEILLADDTTVRLALAPVGAPPGSGSGSGGDARLGGVTPVGRGAQAAAALAVGTLRTVLRPVGLLLQEVHDAVGAADDPPQELSVEFGVQLGQDLKLGIVGANGQASLTISATWKMPERAAGGEPG
ncbi:CU044_2847 family protein [Streptomyces sp. NPDC050610]|uniref:CU044_2847 family protein n=1 Tax=Streptomyces sp. NPDC050610 TaxID=3157097 RepID=UPI00342D32A2